MIIRKEDLGSDEEVDILKGVAKKLDLAEKLKNKIIRQKNNAGRKMTPLEIRKKCWDFWHKSSATSTSSTYLASLRSKNKPKLQLGLPFVDTVKKTTKRNKEFYEGSWMITSETYFEIYERYLSENNEHIGYGTFIALKPFYIRAPKTRDLELCCCKKHLRARWALKSLIELCEKQKISIQFSSYEEFFKHIARTCSPPEDGLSYLNWSCCPDKKTTCEDIKTNWDNLKTMLISNSKDDVFSSMMFFNKVTLTTKKGKKFKKLQPNYKKVNMKDLLVHLENMLPNILHHRNKLRHFRNAIGILSEKIDFIEIDIDFSENLTIPLHKEPQDLHWSKHQISLHTGVLKEHGEKSYHIAFSNDLSHDQCFVKAVLQDILANLNHLNNTDYVLVKSDNCRFQFKSAQNFFELQELSNQYDITIIRIFGIDGHGKSEVDSVGGIAKSSVRTQVARGDYFGDSADVVEFLNNKFSDKSNPSYSVVEITADSLEEDRKAARRYKYSVIHGSDSFYAFVFSPNQTSFKAAPRICVCEKCISDYGSCNLFSSHVLNAKKLNDVCLRAGLLKKKQNDIVDETEEDGPFIGDYLIEKTFCGIAAETNAFDLVWFAYVIEGCVATEIITDDYNHQVSPGQQYFKCHFLEKCRETNKYKAYKMEKRVAFIFRECIVDPLVSFDIVKEEYHITPTNYCNVIARAQQLGYS